MRRFTLMIAFLFGLAAAPLAAHAQDDTDDGDTMDPVTEGLPGDAAEEAREAASFGLETAAQARALGEDASENGRQFGEDTAGRAQDLGDNAPTE